MRAEQWQIDEDEENDWILLDESDFEDCQTTQESRGPPKKLSLTPKRSDNLRTAAGESSLFFFVSAKRARQELEEKHKRLLMSLDSGDIRLIQASWVPARKDPSASGALLFKGLFTKFPEYLKFFSQFSKLDVENLHENKRLIKHAVKVIDTVTFVVDSIGDESKVDQLNEALIKLVRSHLNRRIGLEEFRNLGIVIIDFICDLQQRRRRSPLSRRLTGSSGEHSLESVISSDAEPYQSNNDNHNRSSHLVGSSNIENTTRSGDLEQPRDNQDDESSSSPQPISFATLDASLLVGAWTKLYSTILELVRTEQNSTNQNS